MTDVAESENGSKRITVEHSTAHEPPEMLQRHGEPIQDVYFPDRSLCAVVVPMSDGSAPEIAAVGAEGFIGVECALGLSRAFSLIIEGLSRHGIVSASRGAIRITSRAALEGRACECYRRGEASLRIPASSGVHGDVRWSRILG